MDGRNNLGVNKIGKNIRKSPLHQPNFPPNPTRPQSQPQIYNINKNDFRSIVQQLTGSPSQEPNPPLPPPPQPRPQNNTNLKPPSMRLQRIRPSPLTPMNQQPPPLPQPSPSPGESFWGNTTQSPVSAYMHYLQNSIIEPGPTILPSPRMTNNPPPPLPSPTSQFLLPSPSGFFNPFSPLPQMGILGPGPSHHQHHQPPSPSDFFHFSSPRWRDF